MKRPRIAITGPRRGAFGPRFLVARAIRYYGGVPVQLGPGDERLDGQVGDAGHRAHAERPALDTSRPGHI